jgi:hypothetical protein
MVLGLKRIWLVQHDLAPKIFLLVSKNAPIEPKKGHLLWETGKSHSISKLQSCMRIMMELKIIAAPRVYTSLQDPLQTSPLSALTLSLTIHR